jgi:membrane-associated protease RseP (regulator of RpoE activity)
VIFLLFFGIWTFVILIHVGAIAIVARLFGVKIVCFSLFIGPHLLSFKHNETTYCLSLIPLGGYVKFVGHEEEAVPHTPFAPGDYRALNCFSKCLIAVAGCAALATIAYICLGREDARVAILAGFGQPFQALISPRQLGKNLVLEAMGIISTQPFLVILGLFAAKMAAYNLLPIPLLNGAEVVFQIADWLGLRKSVRESLQYIGLFLIVALLVCWLVAIVYALKG